MAPTSAGAAASGTADQISQLKEHLGTIMAKQEELKEQLKVKHHKAEAAKRISSTVGSTRNLMVEHAPDGNNQTVDIVETPGMQERLEKYSHNVEALEKELEETTELVNEVATALAVLEASGKS